MGMCIQMYIWGTYIQTYIFIYLNVCLGIYVNYCAVFIVVALTCPFMAPPFKIGPSSVWEWEGGE